MGWLLLLLYHMYDSHSEGGTRKYKKIQEKTLRNQMNPCHDFFNMEKKIP